MVQGSLKQEVTHQSYSAISSLNSLVFLDELPSGPGDLQLMMFLEYTIRD